MSEAEAGAITGAFAMATGAIGTFFGTIIGAIGIVGLIVIFAVLYVLIAYWRGWEWNPWYWIFKRTNGWDNKLLERIQAIPEQVKEEIGM